MQVSKLRPHWRSSKARDIIILCRYTAPTMPMLCPFLGTGLSRRRDFNLGAVQQEQPSPTTSKDERIKIRDALLSLGVPEKDVIQHLYSEIFPWRGRLITSIRLFFGGDPFTAEFSLVRDIAHCSSSNEIDDAFFDYRTDPSRRNRGILARILGLTPRKSRTKELYRKLKSSRGKATDPFKGGEAS